ncbi:MerR family transcriptional regulator [Deinococcus sp. KSM4-11]|uniref:MerR family transcriptional regulator n=1 Tax=Deinococcus sp. KSM4-11 TaxID=2568654 RepID=UPI001454CD7A|nr:MerR family transcriptional regulator [Deinococcus sp. KSM4-11]
MLDIAPDWAGGIDEFVTEANTWLARLLPDDRAARPKDEVNPRLVRHYTTLGLIPAPRREGREARYDRAHLLHLLALRRLMADGLSGRVLAGTLSGRSLTELERLAEWGAGEPSDQQAVQASALPAFIQTAPSPALDYLQALKERDTDVGAVRAAPVQFASRPAQRRSSPAQPWTRLSPRPGLEVQISDRFRWPRDEAGWDDLLSELRESLLDVQIQRRRASANDV